MKMTLLLALLISSPSLAPSLAGELEGVKMPDQKTVAGKQLTLNGIGMREATMFKVDVYAGGLYLESPSKNPASILSSPGTKHVDLHFVREIGAKDIREAWSKSIRENCGSSCEADKANTDKLLSLMEDMKPGELMSFTFQPKKTEVSVKGKTAAFESDTFGRTLLSAWLGPKPPNSGLKEGMLGLARR
jgi:hypothetical protein